MVSFKPNKNFKYYLHFVSERQNIFWQRHFDLPHPHTEDKIFQNFKFTNVYRSLDRVSQYLIGNVLYNEKGLNIEYSTEDILYRIFIFKHFNNIETWKLLIKEFGDITTDIKVSELDKFLTELASKGVVLYNNAFMLTASYMRKQSTCDYFGIKQGDAKHTSYLKIFKKDVFNNPEKLYGLLRSDSLEKLYQNLNSICGMGDFLSMQFTIDINYSDLFDFDENDFIMAGLGAVRGIERVFDIEGKPDYVEIIKWVTKELSNLLEDYGIDFEPLPNRNPTLIDIQNCFCETSKYLKGIMPTDEPGNKRIKNFFKPSEREKINYQFPPKWGVSI